MMIVTGSDLNRTAHPSVDMANFAYTNILGTFIFTPEMKLLKHDPDDASGTLKQEFKAKDPSEKDIQNVLAFLRKKEYLELFRERGLIRIRQDIKKSYSRDQLIISTIAYLDDLNIILNMMVKRLRDAFYEIFPEPAMFVRDHERFVELVSTKDFDSILNELGLKKETSMLATVSKDDEGALKSIALAAKSMQKEKARVDGAVEGLMRDLCPNITALTGPAIGARLIQLAGSLKSLSIMPATTLQVLGAERAMFRHVRNKRYLPPKYGILHEHPVFASAKKSLHGKIARALADRIAIAAKIDYFKGEYQGDALKRVLDAKLAIIHKTRGS